MTLPVSGFTKSNHRSEPCEHSCHANIVVGTADAVADAARGTVVNRVREVGSSPLADDG